jgi:thiol-disulfide isomerase/thioredoxin
MALAAQIKSHVKFASMRYRNRMLWRVISVLFASVLALSVSAANFPLKTGAKLVVLVFVSSECPVSNKLAPEIEHLSHKFSTNDVSFNVVYPNASDTAEKISEHRHDYHLTGNFLRDAKHELVRAAGVTITPEAAVFDANRDLVYRGRINDRFLALGKDRPQATQHDLEDAIKSLLAGKKPKHARIEAIGCFIQDAN